MEVVTVEELAAAIGQLSEALRVTALEAARGCRAPEHFTRAEAAEDLRTSVSKLDRLTAARQIRRAMVGDRPIYRKRDLDAFVGNELELGKAEARVLANRHSLN